MAIKTAMIIRERERFVGMSIGGTYPMLYGKPIAATERLAAGIGPLPGWRRGTWRAR